MYCKDCGKLIDDTSSYCNHCGKPQSLAGNRNETRSSGWLTHASLASSVLAVIFYFVTFGIAAKKAEEEMLRYADSIKVVNGLWVESGNYQSVPYSTLVPTGWLVMTCIASFLAFMFMLISWSRNKDKLGLNILATVMACLVTFVSIMMIVSPESMH